MQEVNIAAPGLGLAGDGPLLAGRPALGHDAGSGAGGEVIAEPLDDEAALGEHEALGAAGGRDTQHGGLAERVDLLELRRGELRGRVAVEDLDRVLELELVEEPDDALSSGVVEPMGGERGDVCEYRRLLLPVECNVRGELVALPVEHDLGLCLLSRHCEKGLGMPDERDRLRMSLQYELEDRGYRRTSMSAPKVSSSPTLVIYCLPSPPLTTKTCASAADHGHLGTRPPCPPGAGRKRRTDSL